jgi:hypothetical protein
MPSRSIRRARRQKPHGSDGFIVTWDVDTANQAQCARVRRFVFGYSLRQEGRVYRYAGFVERDGVRYLGQSVLFVPAASLGDLLSFLRTHGVDHVVTVAWLGAIMPS